VSPGSPSGAVVASVCPTFDWSGLHGTMSYEIVVYRVEQGEEPVLALAERVPGGALGWTPALGRCLEPGGDYAWMVRAAGADGSSEWSEPLFFQIVAGPREEDLQQALLVVERYLAARREGGEGLDTPAATSRVERVEVEPAAAPTLALDGADFSVDSSGNVAGLSFAGDGSGLSGVTAGNLGCAACVSESELDFDPATQSELDGHDHGAAWGGWEIVTSSNCCAAHALCGATATCSAGKRVLGGGVSADYTGTTVWRSHPYGEDGPWETAWRASVINPAAAACVTVYAICANVT